MKKRTLKELKILLVEDEESLARLLKEAIGDSFHSFTIAKDGVEGMELFRKIKPDIVITDIMMPHKTGLEMAREIREVNTNIPIIVLSAFSEKEKLFGAIDAGVSKYFLKPYHAEDILEYINSITSKIQDRVVKLNECFVFNKTTNSLYKNEKYVALTKNEVKFLTLLLESKNKTLDEVSIKESLWGNEASDERVRTFIKRLREKTSKNLVKNIKGFGYQLISES
ncbi:MAG: response regulator transcription factor [Sulfurimonas sp.]|uniref:response regulator transcription factor n=1 Tax=Sulfurimonas sp. TaxID=2022749 RepID=UPI00263487C8|nr:response regulator transcription factor [Sulfurimonas sp.]MDD2652706.1 response regulator transcription factor [Sulfurimonas sp.]MDD3450660.1 response regulator transcription factor [Sulfurimonas sp.]